MTIFIAIFILKLVEVIISTHQIKEIANGRRNRATVLGGISCVLWLLALRTTVFDGAYGFISYCLAYTLGTFFGMWSLKK